jgi:hypothetical protein
MDKITCPTCGFSIAVEREGDEFVLTFNIVEGTRYVLLRAALIRRSASTSSNEF